MKKVSTLSVVLLVIVLLCLVGGVWYYGAGQPEEVFPAASLARETIADGATRDVAFDVTGKDTVETGFQILPVNGKITVKYLEGDWSGMTVRLYRPDLDDWIMGNEIEKAGGKIVFSYLAANQPCYFQMIAADPAEQGSQVVMRFEQ